jgi:hypothetical protein
VALILGDYDYIMPLPQRRKLTFTYLYQPIGMAQGGIFSKHNISEEVEEEFLKVLLSKFSYGHISLNENFITTEFSESKIISRDNYVLDIGIAYPTLFNNYNEDGKKNVRRARQMSQHICFDSDPNNTLIIYLQQYASKINIKKLGKDYEVLAATLSNLITSQMAFTICSRNSEGQLLASAVFGIYKKRLYYLLGAPTAIGRKFKSMHFIIDAVIEKYAGKGYLLDFEGSEIPTVATFYKKFGPINKPYKVIHFNKLPPIIRKFKK